MKKYYLGFTLILAATSNRLLNSMQAPKRITQLCASSLPTVKHLLTHTFATTASSPAPDLSDNRSDHVDTTKYPHFSNFLKSYPLPKKFSNALLSFKQDQEKLSLVKEKIYTGTSKGPLATHEGICIKAGALDRVLNAIRMQNYFDKKEVNSQLGVTEKHIAYLENGTWVVLAQQIPDTTLTEKFSSSMADTLIHLAADLGFADWNSLAKGMSKNWHYTDNKLVCIDTEKAAFSTHAFICLFMLKQRWGSYFEPHDLKKLEMVFANSDKCNPSLALYDSKGHNFEKIAEEFKELTNKS